MNADECLELLNGMTPLTLEMTLSPLNAIHGHGRIDGKPHHSKERHAPKERVIE
ncbi:MAG: hypothetical protein KGI42_14545 [Xanthomonadaceae bacterium]|nr:hypothetical protein [Xanthomonadaceae bacterium]